MQSRPATSPSETSERSQKNSKLFIDHKLQINTQYTEQNTYLKNLFFITSCMVPKKTYEQALVRTLENDKCLSISGTLGKNNKSLSISGTLEKNNKSLFVSGTLENYYSINI